MNPNNFTSNQDSLTFHIRLTKKCNADCSYCSSFEHKNTNLMSIEDLKKSINYLKKIIIDKKIGGKRKHLTVQYVGGEVLIVPQDYLKEFTEIVKNNLTTLFDSFSHGVQSNLIASHAKVEKLFEIFDGNVGTSFDNHTNQRTIKQNESSYKKIFFDNFSHIKRKYGTNLPGIIVVDKKMYPFVDKEIEIAEKNKTNLTLRPVFQGGSSIDSINEDMLTPLYEKSFDSWFMKKNIIIEPFFSLLVKRLNNKKNNIKKLINYSGCPFQHNCATSSINLEPNGSIYVCLDMADSKHYSIGNAILGTFDEDTFNMLNQRSEKLSSDCISCDYFKECQGGCMNEAIEHTGDVFGKTQYCQTWKAVFRKIDLGIEHFGISSTESWLSKIDKNY